MGKHEQGHESQSNVSCRKNDVAAQSREIRTLKFTQDKNSQAVLSQA